MTHGQPNEVTLGHPHAEGERPALGTPTGQEQKVSWLELLFDLIFVVAFDQLAKRLGDSASGQNIGLFALMFVAVWWSWSSNALFAARYGNECRVYRWGTLAQAVTVALIATIERGDLTQTGGYFAVCFGLNRLIQAGLNIWADRQTPTNLTLSRRAGILLSVLGVLWIVSAWLPGGSAGQLWVWVLLTCTDLLSPLFIRQKGLLPHEGHLPERIGLMQIIALGGVINELVGGSRQQELTPLRLLPPLFSLLTVVSLWRLYFDQARALPLLLAHYRGQGRGVMNWLYSHLPLTLSIVVLGVGLGHGLSSAEAEEVALRQRFVVWPLAALLLNLAFLRWNSRRVLGQTGLDRSLLALCAGALGAAALSLPDLDARQLHGAVAALTLVLAALVATDPVTRTLGQIEEKISERLEEQAEQAPT